MAMVYAQQFLLVADLASTIVLGLQTPIGIQSQPIPAPQVRLTLSEPLIHSVGLVPKAATEVPAEARQPPSRQHHRREEPVEAQEEGVAG